VKSSKRIGILPIGANGEKNHPRNDDTLSAMAMHSLVKPFADVANSDHH
jgi:hypothetical protein